MLKKSLIITLGMIMSGLISLNSFATDSSAVTFKKYSPVMPQVTYTEDCVDSGKITSALVMGFGGTLGTKTASCPTGYFPRELKVNVLGIGSSSGSTWQWQCCKTVVAYPKNQ